jgi:hypothetical protein
MKRAAVLPFLVFALACADTPTEVTPDDLALAADHHGNKVVLIVTGGAHADAAPALGGGVFPEGSMLRWSFTARQTLSGDVSGNLHYNLKKATTAVIDLSIDCLSLVGNTAYVGTTITAYRDAAGKDAGRIGTQMVFKATAPGEGSAAPPDEISDNIFLWALRDWSGLPEGTCEDPEIQEELDGFTGAIGTYLPLSYGNVQIIDKR